jgi:hypothetical protein
LVAFESEIISRDRTVSFCSAFRSAPVLYPHGPMATAPPLAAPSAQASHTLRDAFERFALSVSQDDQLLFHNTELKDVRDEALQIEKQLRKSRIQKNIARLDPLLRGMEHYSKVVEVLCNGTPYLSWIWAPIKLMLMVSHVPSQNPDHLSRATDHG